MKAPLPSQLEASFALKTLEEKANSPQALEIKDVRDKIKGMKKQFLFNDNQSSKLKH